MEISVRSRASSEGRSPQTGVGVSCKLSAGPGLGRPSCLHGGAASLSHQRGTLRQEPRATEEVWRREAPAASPQSPLLLASLGLKKNSSPGNREDRRGRGLGWAVSSAWTPDSPASEPLGVVVLGDLGVFGLLPGSDPAPPPPSPSPDSLLPFVYSCSHAYGALAVCWAQAQPPGCTGGGDGGGAVARRQGIHE